MLVQVAGIYGFEEGYTLGHMDGWSWLWMTTGWLATIVVIALIVWAVQRGTATVGSPSPSALDILATRYARGEITAEEYEERRMILERH